MQQEPPLIRVGRHPRRASCHWSRTFNADKAGRRSSKYPGNAGWTRLAGTRSCDRTRDRQRRPSDPQDLFSSSGRSQALNPSARQKDEGYRPRGEAHWDPGISAVLTNVPSAPIVVRTARASPTRLRQTPPGASGFSQPRSDTGALLQGSAPERTAISQYGVRMTNADRADEALHLLVEGNARFQRGEARFMGMRPDALCKVRGRLSSPLRQSLAAPTRASRPSLSSMQFSANYLSFALQEMSCRQRSRAVCSSGRAPSDAPLCRPRAFRLRGCPCCPGLSFAR